MRPSYGYTCTDAIHGLKRGAITRNGIGVVRFGARVLTRKNKKRIEVVNTLLLQTLKISTWLAGLSGYLVGKMSWLFAGSFFYCHYKKKLQKKFKKC